MNWLDPIIDAAAEHVPAWAVPGDSRTPDEDARQIARAVLANTRVVKVANDHINSAEHERDLWRARAQERHNALELVLAMVWPDPDHWTPHAPNEECDAECALMRTLHEAQDLVELPISSLSELGDKEDGRA